MQEVVHCLRFNQVGGNTRGPTLEELIQAAHHGAVGEAAVFLKLQDIAEGDEPAGRAFRLGDHGESSISWGTGTSGFGKKGPVVIMY